MPFLIISMLWMFLSCQVSGDKASLGKSDSLAVAEYHEYSSIQEKLEERKTMLLSFSEKPSEVPFLFSEDSFLMEKDPKTYWLMDNMMRMSDHVFDAEDYWAWMLAMNERVKQYNEWRGLRELSSKEALTAIDRLMEYYRLGDRTERNAAGYVGTTLNDYRTLLSYRSIIDGIDGRDFKGRLGDLYFREFRAWYEINHQMDALMNHYTYDQADYASCFDEIYSTYNGWLRERNAALELEQGILLGEVPLSVSIGKPISRSRFKSLFNYYKNGSIRTAINRTKSSEGQKDKEVLLSSRTNLEYITTIIERMEASVLEWLKVRDDIRLCLPDEMREPYRSVTRRLYAQLYDDVLDLQQMRL